MASLAKATTEQLLAELQRRLKCADKQEKKTIFIGARLFACLLALLCWIGLGEAGVVPWLGCACLLDVVGGRGGARVLLCGALVGSVGSADGRGSIAVCFEDVGVRPSIERVKGSIRLTIIDTRLLLLCCCHT